MDPAFSRSTAGRPADDGTGVGTLLRGWRERRRFSQLALALEAGISTRHLSFIETGRARPSAGMLITLAEQLQVPLRERNRLLLAAGHAPRYGERPLDDAAMQKVRGALQRLLSAHDPCPGLVLDRRWNIVLANGAATGLTALLPPFLREPPINVFRASLHPEGLAGLTVNFPVWAGYLLGALDRAAAGAGDDATLGQLVREVAAYPNVAALGAQRGRESAPLHDELLVPCVLDVPAGRLALFTTLTTFGTPRDVTLDELSVELFYPADEATDRLLRRGPPAEPPA